MPKPKKPKSLNYEMWEKFHKPKRKIEVREMAEIFEVKQIIKEHPDWPKDKVLKAVRASWKKTKKT